MDKKKAVSIITDWALDVDNPTVNNDRQYAIASALAEAEILEIQNEPDWDMIYNWILEWYVGYNELSLLNLARMYVDMIGYESEEDLKETLNCLLIESPN